MDRAALTLALVTAVIAISAWRCVRRAFHFSALFVTTQLYQPFLVLISANFHSGHLVFIIVAFGPDLIDSTEARRRRIERSIEFELEFESEFDWREPAAAERPDGTRLHCRRQDAQPNSGK